MDKMYMGIFAFCAVGLGVGGYLMSGPFDTAPSALKPQVVQKVSREDPKPGAGTLLGNLWSAYNTKLETARNTYLGEHFPKTPEGWVIKDTNNPEIIAFTVDYKLDLTILDKSSMRGMSGMGDRFTDLAFHKDDKVIFMRLNYDPRERRSPRKASASWLFNGISKGGDPIMINGVDFQRRTYEGTDIINLAGVAGPYAGIGILSNATMAEVEKLMSGMDVYEFSRLRSAQQKLQGEMVAPQLAANHDVRVSKPSGTAQNFGTGENMLANIDDDAPVDTEVKPKKPRQNLLAALLGSKDDKLADDAKKTGAIEQVTLGRTKVGNSTGSTSGGFAKVGSFKSNCSKSNGAKFCSIGTK